MPGEEWARRIIQNHLGRGVEINDDGSSSGVYDLRVGPADAPDIAIEVIGAVDEQFTETWNVGPAKGPLQLAVAGDWIVTVKSGALIKRIEQKIEPRLRWLEDHEIRDLVVDFRLRRWNEPLFNELESLGIALANCTKPVGGGKVHISMEGIGGAVDEEGRALPEWLGEFLRDPKRDDVVRKLKTSGAVECHVFVIVSFGGAPWLVESYLTGSLDCLPSRAPDLPDPITHVWAVTELGQANQQGIHWDGTQWKRFHARGSGIDGNFPRTAQ